MKWCAAFFICFYSLACKTVASSQSATQHAIPANIKTVQLYKNGNQTSFPLLQLGSADGLELHFDDLDATVKNYYYTFQLCNWDWSLTLLNPFEYT